MSLSIYQIYRLFRRRFGYSFFNAFWLLSEIPGWLGGWNVYLYRELCRFLYRMVLYSVLAKSNVCCLQIALHVD